MRSDRLYLEHILDSIAAIETYVSGGEQAFISERMIQDAVIRNFEIIGEAASRIAPDVRAETPIPWKRIIAFRNRLIHAYWGVDLVLVWDVIRNELPPLKSEVERLLREVGNK
ncbi:MAG TPA: DUF86 domain-containing protein [Methylocystis sp.]